MKPMDFRGKWVLVTGASSGLGRDMARILAKVHGANIIPVARRKERLLELKQELESSAGVRVDPLAIDMSKPDNLEAILSHATDGRSLYGAVLNAGVTHFGNYHEL